MSRCQDRQADSDAPRSKGPTRNYETNPIRPGTRWAVDANTTPISTRRWETGDSAAREAGNWRCVDHQSHSASNGIHEIFNQFDFRLTKIFTLAGGTRLRTMFDIFNVFNANAVTREQPGFGPGYLQPPGDHAGPAGQVRVPVRLLDGSSSERLQGDGLAWTSPFFPDRGNC